MDVSKRVNELRHSFLDHRTRCLGRSLTCGTWRHIYLRRLEGGNRQQLLSHAGALHMRFLAQQMSVVVSFTAVHAHAVDRRRQPQVFL